MAGKKIGYARVSSTDQNLDRQLDELAGIGMDKIFADRISGAGAARPELERCMEYVREDDELYVCSIDRLARNLGDLKRLIDDLVGRGVTVHFIKERLDFGGGSAKPMETLLLHVLGAFAEFERSLIRERQADGIRAARARGKRFGRPPLDLGPEADGNRVAELAAQGLSVREIAVHLGVSKTTAHRMIRAARENRA